MRPDDGPGRDAHDEISPVAAVGPASHAAPAVARSEVAPALEVAQCRHAGLDHEHDVAAVPAVAAIGAATRNVSLAPERAGAVSAGAAAGHDPRSISEHLGRA
jgi:hypothetical protein